MVNQRDSSVRKKFITFMVLPHNALNKVWRVNLPYWLAGLFAGIAGAFLLFFLGLFIYSSIQGFQWIHYQALLHENKYQETQIKAFFEKTKGLENGIRELEERDQELREMLGLQKNKKPVKVNDVQTIDQLHQRLAMLNEYVLAKKQEYGLLKEASAALAYKFNNFPSLAPANQPVFQKMGWRIHPFTGKAEMHKGIDIPVWVGYPVKAAADGRIFYSGWSRGYGETIIIDHGNGYKTLYGHNQRLIAKKGQQVYKGQVVAKAGSTGLSTGPHVHYEVLIADKAVNPENYLDLNIRSARRL